LSDCTLDAATLDSEGRCVILEFPAFVLIGVYCPANRDETRDEFRVGFLNALDARVRNIVAADKRVFLTGDLNIIRGELDTAKAEEHLRKEGITMEQFISTPARRMLNQLLFGGDVVGDRDEGREKPILWDLCRSFHPDRKGMFTCWNQKINARPGNFGSRIDYVLCSEDWKDWFCDSNIQEGLMGSDHCPVYAVLKEKISLDGKEVYIRDIMSAGMFKDGVRLREWSMKDLLPTSAKLIPEFDRRRNIRDMFSKKPSVPAEGVSNTNTESDKEDLSLDTGDTCDRVPGASSTPAPSTPAPDLTQSWETSASPATTPKRQNDSLSATTRPMKRNKPIANSKSASLTSKNQPEKGQSSLMGFFKPKTQADDQHSQSSTIPETESDSAVTVSESPTPLPSAMPLASDAECSLMQNSQTFDLAAQKNVIDPIVSKESWSKLLGKRVAPRCEHNEPCISLVTKKPGVNCGRSFYICPRPLGPSGQKEKNTQWRCGTFIWSSDWSGDGG
jgi:AP endonuclease 2